LREDARSGKRDSLKNDWASRRAEPLNGIVPTTGMKIHELGFFGAST